MAAIVLKTPRLQLRALREDDFPRLVQFLNSWDVARWMAVVPYPYTVQHAHEFMVATQDGLESQRAYQFVLADAYSDELLGGIGLQDRHPDGDWDIGYWLGKPYWGQGLAREAIAAIVRFGFEDLNLPQIGAVVHMGNQRSQHVLEKTGFTYTGLHPAPAIKNRLRGTPLVHSYLKQRADRL